MWAVTSFGHSGQLKYLPGEAWAVEITRSVVDSELGCQNYAASLLLFQPATHQLEHFEMIFDQIC